LYWSRLDWQLQITEITAVDNENDWKMKRTPFIPVTTRALSRANKPNQCLHSLPLLAGQVITGRDR